ncbi:MAG: hypothetical protein ETSY2_27870 [Candidatus Entotheonella gemina]|uniref:Uncharacterized protein n=1 Tax=Candidatus Entotheonella gemina TaxID=1429439 RepID=W4M3R3_9BACT|nr:MAG: hypothetical protein ETSY2_27870 [Candidatus Entotheonella gemina]
MIAAIADTHTAIWYIFADVRHQSQQLPQILS